MSLIYLIILPFQLFSSEGHSLPLDINLRHFSEKDSLAIFLVELTIFVPTTFLNLAFSTFSLSFFILFTCYIVGQLELIAQYMQQLDTTDPILFAKTLGEVVELHLDALR